MICYFHLKLNFMFGFSLDKGAVSPEIITTIEDVKNLEGDNIGYRQIFKTKFIEIMTIFQEFNIINNLE